MSNNDITDFLLKEYENIAQAYFSAHELTAKWFKFYLLIIASPFSIIVFVYNNKSVEFDLFKLSSTISILMFVIGFLSTLVSFIIINSRLDASLYARTVNGIRKYFLDQEINITVELRHLKKINEYIILPIDTKKPKFLKYEGDLFILIIIMSLINAFYIAHGCTQIIKFTGYCKVLLFLMIFIFVIVLHLLYYYSFANKKENTYSKNNN